MSHDPVSRPAHYTAGPVECIDIIRDELGDEGFSAYCRGNALKYLHRAGLKGDRQEDYAKAAWYTMMDLHVRGLGPDPRAGRPGFQPYVPR